MAPTAPTGAGGLDGSCGLTAASLTRVTATETTPAKERWRAQWAELFTEVVTSGLCTGCAGCVVACPHDVLGYDDTNGVYRPFHLEDELGPGDCGHGLRGCTSCTRACPRFRNWETEIDSYLFGREREPDEMDGVSKDIFLARAADPELHERGQDGGLVSAILLWCLEQRPHRRRPGVVARRRRQHLEGRSRAGPHPGGDPGLGRVPLHLLGQHPGVLDAVESGAERLALVGMSCQASVPGVMRARKAGKVGRRLALSIGLLCSKTFDDAIFDELFEAKYGLKRADIVKMNIKGVFQIWMRDGSYHEINLKECHQWTREGCKTCPDFAAEHADIATGGIGAFNDWTLTLVRTDAGREIIDGMIADEVIETRPGDDDPGAIALLRKLSIVSRRRWPETAVAAPRLGVPPPKAKSAGP